MHSEALRFTQVVVLPVLCGISWGLSAYQVLSSAGPLLSGITIGSAAMATIITLNSR